MLPDALWTRPQEIKQYLEKLLRQRLGNRNGNGDGHADHRVVAPSKNEYLGVFHRI